MQPDGDRSEKWDWYSAQLQSGCEIWFRGQARRVGIGHASQRAGPNNDSEGHASAGVIDSIEEGKKEEGREIDRNRLKESDRNGKERKGDRPWMSSSCFGFFLPALIAPTDRPTTTGLRRSVCNGGLMVHVEAGAAVMG